MYKKSKDSLINRHINFWVSVGPAAESLCVVEANLIGNIYASVMAVLLRYSMMQNDKSEFEVKVTADN